MSGNQNISNNLSVANSITANNITVSNITSNNGSIDNLTINNVLTTSKDINCNSINSTGTISAINLSIPAINCNSINLANVDLNTRIANIETKDTSQDTSINSLNTNVNNNTTSINAINSSLTNKANLNTNNSFTGNNNTFKRILCERIDASTGEIYSESQFTINTSNFSIKDTSVSSGYLNVSDKLANLSTSVNTLNTNVTNNTSSINKLNSSTVGMGVYYDLGQTFVRPNPASSASESDTFATFNVTSAMTMLGTISYNFPVSIRYKNLVNLNWTVVNTLSNLTIRVYKNGSLFTSITNPPSTTSYATSFTVNNNGNSNINAEGEQYFGNITVNFQPSSISSGTDIYTFKAIPTFVSDYTSQWNIRLTLNTNVSSTTFYTSTLNFNTATSNKYTTPSYLQYPVTQTNNFYSCDYGNITTLNSNNITAQNLHITNISSSASNDEINMNDVTKFNDVTNFNSTANFNGDMNCNQLLNINKALTNNYLNVNTDTLTINSSNIYSVYFLKGSSTVTCTITLTDLGSTYDGLTITIRQLGGSGKSFKINAGSGVVIRKKDNSEGNIDEGNVNTSILMFVNSDKKWYELARV